MKEIYKDIPNYEGLYQVSNLGNVKSLARVSSIGRNLKEKILTPREVGGGYTQFTLYSLGEKLQIYTHQLVAMAFLSHIPDGHNYIVDHIDNNPLNNNLLNLQIVSQRTNSSKDKKGTSLYTGVSFAKKSKKWLSQITVNYKKIYLGHFDCEIEAHEAYQNKLKEISK